MLQPGRSTKTLIPVVLLAALCCIYYFPSMSSFFAEDDFSHLYAASRTSPTDICAMFKPHTFFYRPLSTPVYFGITLRLFGLSPLSYHLSALCLFCVNVLLAFWLGRCIFRDSTSGFLVALLYLTRGVHFDTVTWISIFQEPLMCFFSFLCLLLYVKYSLGKTRWLFLSVITYVLACLSKETALLLPFIVLAYELALNQGAAVRKRVLGVLLFLFVMVLSGVARRLYVGPLPSVGEYKLRIGFFFIPKLAKYFMFCINSLFLPYILIPHNYRYLLQIFFCLLIALATILVLASRFRNKRGGENSNISTDQCKHVTKLSAFGLAFFVVGAAPALPIERFEAYYMSLASLGVCILIVAWSTLVSNKRLIILAAVCVVIIGLFTNVQLRTRQLSHGLRFASLAEQVLDDLREPLTSAPPGTTIYIIDSDKTLISAIFFGYGIRLFFPAVDSVMFDLTNREYKLDGSEMVFRYSSGRLKPVHLRPSRTRYDPHSLRRSP